MPVDFEGPLSSLGWFRDLRLITFSNRLDSARNAVTHKGFAGWCLIRGQLGGWNSAAAPTSEVKMA